MNHDSYQHIIDRIQRLMAIAQDDAASDNEAQLAFEQAQKLIDKYKIEHWADEDSI